MRQRSGGVECGKCERTHACNILYFCKEAGVHHVDAVSEQSNTISASWGCLRASRESLKMVRGSVKVVQIVESVNVLMLAISCSSARWQVCSL